MLSFTGSIFGSIFGLLVVGGAIQTVSQSSNIFLNWASTLMAPAVSALSNSLPAWVTISLLLVILANIVAYIYASAALGPVIDATPISKNSPAPLPVESTEQIVHGFLFGLNAMLNFGIWVFLDLEALGIWVGIIGYLAVFYFISRNRIYQRFLGWSSWVMPMSYWGTGIGLIFFLINVPFNLSTAGPKSIRIDWTTGAIESTGGIIAKIGLALKVLSPRSGFSAGNFTFVTPAVPSPDDPFGLRAQTSFTEPGISSHETGHTLNTAAFGGIFLLLNAVDENFPPFERKANSYAELTTDSHYPRNQFRQVRIWS